MKTLILFGLGDLGGWVLEFIVRRHGLNRIIACDLMEDWGRLKVDGAATGAGQKGYNKIRFFRLFGG